MVVAFNHKLGGGGDGLTKACITPPGQAEAFAKKLEELRKQFPDQSFDVEQGPKSRGITPPDDTEAGKAAQDANRDLGHMCDGRKIVHET